MQARFYLQNAGDKVLIKVNICGGVPELKGTYTTKEVAGVVVDMVRKAGGEPFICDADVIISMPEIDKARYHKIGIDEVIADLQMNRA
jgi:uncharacterized protein (DUF362 family)